MLKRRQFLKFSASPKTQPDGYWVHLNRPAMACRFEATLPSSDRTGTNVALNALAEVDRLEQQLTIFKDSSEVSSINRTAALHPVQVEPSLFALLLLSQQLCLDTEGAFDITSGPLSDCWGFLRRQGRVPESAEIEAAKALAGADRLELDRESRALRFLGGGGGGLRGGRGGGAGAPRRVPGAGGRIPRGGQHPPFALHTGSQRRLRGHDG